MYVCLYVYMYVCMFLCNASGMQLCSTVCSYFVSPRKMGAPLGLFGRVNFLGKGLRRWSSERPSQMVAPFGLVSFYINEPTFIVRGPATIELRMRSPTVSV